MKIIISLLLLFSLLIVFINGQWSNLYVYSDSNCGGNEIPGLISTKLDTCIGIVKYSCNANTTTENLYYNNDCLVKSNTVTFNNYICDNGQTVNCSLSSAPTLPSNSYVMAVYSSDSKDCDDDQQIIQYHTTPLNTCYGGTIYTCTSNTLTINKYESEDCVKFVNKNTQDLGCVDGNSIYTNYLKYYCT